MSIQESPKPKKTDITIWIIVAIAVVLICCVLTLLAIGGGFYYLERSGRVNVTPPGIPLPSVPGQIVPTVTPGASNGSLVVEPFDPSSSSYPALAELDPNWTDATKPGTQNLTVTVSSRQPVTIMLGWCTTTSTILQENFQHINWSLTVDYQPVEVQKLFLWNDQESDRICKTYVGLVRQWTGSQHKIITTMTITQKINDGWNDYLPGDYTDVYSVTVSP